MAAQLDAGIVGVATACQVTEDVRVGDLDEGVQCGDEAAMVVVAP